MLQEQLCNFLGQRSRVQVSTVDAYQGSEREVIIISCVRTEKIGFIANPNRVNVALSRARRHCLVLGARKLLETNSMWRRILEYCRQDDDNAGVVSAQSFLNRLANAVVNNSKANAGGDSNDSTELPAMDYDLELDYGICLSPAANDAGLESEQQSTFSGSVAVVDTDDEGDESSVAECEYGDEGVVGGSLSQWSMPGIFIESGDDDEDVLDCLDVDANDM
ncbi:Protein zgrf1 [Coemansia sp. RSA 1694]|nr:Protein zgrf1 [Coemansia sp. RSA 1694]